MAEWLNSMSSYGQPQQVPTEEEMVDDEDFYGNVTNETQIPSTRTSNTLPGASQDGTAQVGTT